LCVELYGDDAMQVQPTTVYMTVDIREALGDVRWRLLLDMARDDPLRQVCGVGGGGSGEGVHGNDTHDRLMPIAITITIQTSCPCYARHTYHL
jgi:hypothetical protein